MESGTGRPRGTGVVPVGILSEQVPLPVVVRRASVADDLHPAHGKAVIPGHVVIATGVGADGGVADLGEDLVGLGAHRAPAADSQCRGA